MPLAPRLYGAMLRFALELKAKAIFSDEGSFHPKTSSIGFFRDTSGASDLLWFDHCKV